MGSLSEKQLFIVVLLVAVLVSGAFGVLSFMEYQKIEDKKLDIGNVQKEIDRYRQKERKINLIENDLTYMRGRHSDNKKALPEWRFENALLKGIQAQATAAKVKITGVSPEASRATRFQKTSANPWDSFKLKIDVQGFFFDILKFTNLLEHYPRLLAINTGKLSKSSKSQKVKHSTPAGGEGEGEVIDSGPLLDLKIEIEAFLIKKAAAAPVRRPATSAKAAPTAKDAKAAPARPKPGAPPKPAPKAPPKGKVYKVDEDFKIPEDEMVKVENRRNPFIVWLEPKVVEEEPGKPGMVEKVPKDAGEIMKLLKSWKERLDTLTVMQAHRDKPKETYFAWKALVKEVTQKKLPHPYSAQREEVLQSLLAEGFQSQILAEYDAYLEEVARKFRIRMETGHHIGMPSEVNAAFKELLIEILAGDRLPPRVRRELKTCMNIFLDTMRILVEEEGEYKTVLQILDEIKKLITDEWVQKPFIRDFLLKAEEFRVKAQALVEFFGMDILVSGLVWLPDNAHSKRIAIVNDSAILEGENVPVKAKVAFRSRKGGPSFPVTLQTVGRDRFVWFGYKGLKIKYPLGKRAWGKLGK